MAKFRFSITGKDPKTAARLGRMETSHGSVETPAFMPCASYGAVKSCSPGEVAGLGVQMLAANAYHLHLRPGEELIQRAGGLHAFMGWERPILTDSGGYQVFSMSDRHKVTDAGVELKSYVDGSVRLFTPEKCVEVQAALGADIAMQLDWCTPYPCEREQAAEAVRLTSLWGRRSKAAHSCEGQALFGIVQGSIYRDLRQQSLEELMGIRFDGYAIGGLSVGEGLERMEGVLAHLAPRMPEGQVRYLMGVGEPADLVACVKYGIDLFDCAAPTKNARHGMLYTSRGELRVRNSEHAQNTGPPDPECDCYTCTNFSVAYLRYLFMAGEPLALRLNSLHNLRHYVRLMERIREAIRTGRLTELESELAALQQAKGESVASAPGADD